MIPPRCADPSRLFVAIDVSWWCMVAFSIVCKPTDDPVVKCPEMRPILYGWLAALLGGKRPAYVAALLDSKGPTWRHAETAHLPPPEQYKAGRTKRPREFHAEVDGFIELLKLHGIPCYRAEGWEADDVAAVVTAHAVAHGLDVALVTLDHDWRALVRDRDGDGPEVYCWSYGRTDATTIGVAEVLASDALGVAPEHVPSMIALVGDGDNIGGVRGIGPPKARTVLARWGSVPEILAADPLDVAHAEAEIKRLGKELAKEKRKPGGGALADLADLDQAIHAWRCDVKAEKYRAMIAARADAVRLGLLLATLDPNAPISPPFDLDACKVGGFNVQALTRLYRGLGFNVLADDVAASEVAA